MKAFSHRFSRFVAAVCAMTSFASAASATDVLKEHLDLDIDYTGGILTLDWRTYGNMSPGVPLNNDDWAAPGNALVIPIANSYVVPAGAQWACLGATGSTVYRAKQNFVSNELWVGWNAQDVAVGAFQSDKVQLEVVSVVSAPVNGRFILYTTNTFGTPTYQLNTTAGACNDSSMDVSAGPTFGHVHGWWTFSAPGTYTIRFRARGTLAGGTVVTSSNVDYTFKVQ